MRLASGGSGSDAATAPGGDAWLDRYSRQIMLDQIGYEGQKRLAGSRALVVGAGGLGSVILERLAGMGVGTVVVVDRDVVEEGNLHRQTLYGEDDVGRGKAAAAADRMRRINGSICATAVAAPLAGGNAAGLVEGCDVAIDALDTAGARHVLNEACIAAGVPLVCGSAVGVEGQAMTVLPGKTACYRCVYGTVDDAAMPKCSTTGVHPSILSVVGGIEAAEAVSVMAGREPSLAGRLFHADLGGMEFAKMAVSADPECAACGSGRTAGVDSGGGDTKRRHGAACAAAGGLAVEELCGRGRGKRTFAVSKCMCGACESADGGGAAEAEATAAEAAECGGGNGDDGAGGARVTLVGPSCGIVVGASSADDARSLYARAAAGGNSAAGSARPRIRAR